MATNLSGVLASVPGLAGYLAKQQLDQQQEMGQVQQLGALAQLQAQMQNQQAQAQNRQRQEAARQALARLGPDATEDQRVNALLPHIGDPDKIAGILQNASLKKAQQEQTKQLAMTRLQQQASQHLDNLAVKIQNAKTAEERSHWEQQVAQAQLGFRQQAADIAAGRFNYETGMTVPSLPRPFIPGAMGASAAPAGPTPQPTPSAAPGPVPAPSEAPGGPVPGPMMDSSGLGKLTPDQLAMGIQEAIVSGGQYPNDPAHKAAYDRFVAEAQRRGMSVNAPFPQAAPSAAVPAPTAAPQAAPQPAPAPAPQPDTRKQLTIDDAPAGLTPRQKQEWLLNETKKQNDADKFGREAVARQVAKGLEDSYTKLREAPQALANIERAKALIPDARAFQGSLGEQKLAAAKFFNNNLGMNIDMNGVQSAEELRSRIFFNIMDNLKKMDSQPSENQQRIMQEALGKLGTDPGALPRILDAFGDVIRDKVTAYDKQVEEAKTSGVNWPHRIVLPARAASQSGGIREFATEAEAAAANLAPGTRVKIGGKTGTWR